MTVLLAAEPADAGPPSPGPAAQRTEDAPLAVALTRFLATTGAPAYLRAPAAAWLAAQPTTEQ